MRRENYNLSVDALDDRALYREVCKKIKETNAVSLRLLAFVPLFSGLSVLVLFSIFEAMSPVIIFITGVFGALITFFMYRWEIGNIRIRNIFISYAEILEAKKMKLEENSKQIDMTLAGPYSLMKSREKSQGGKSRIILTGADRHGVEMAIFGATLLFWLLLPLLVLIK